MRWWIAGAVVLAVVVVGISVWNAAYRSPEGGDGGQRQAESAEPTEPTEPTEPNEPIPPQVWPDESNTGVPASTVLKPYDGPFTVTTAGTVIDGYDINGTLIIDASDVTIKNSRVTGRIDTGDANKNPRTMIQRVEIIGPYNSAAD
ncbi:hypothetical protein, partial [Marisediminicola antarctica]